MRSRGTLTPCRMLPPRTSNRLHEQQRGAKKFAGSSGASAKTGPGTRDWTTEQMDVNQPVPELISFVDDRLSLLDQVLSMFRTHQLKDMLPDVIKETPVDAIKDLCLPFLNLMSNEEIKKVILDDPGVKHGQEFDDAAVGRGNAGAAIEGTKMDEDQVHNLQNVNYNKAGRQVRDVEIQVDFGDDEDSSASSDGSTSPTNSPPRAEDDGYGWANIWAQTQMEILELEMRARAIRSLMKVQKAEGQPGELLDEQVIEEGVPETAGDEEEEEEEKRGACGRGNGPAAHQHESGPESIDRLESKCNDKRDLFGGNEDGEDGDQENEPVNTRSAEGGAIIPLEELEDGEIRAGHSDSGQGRPGSEHSSFHENSSFPDMTSDEDEDENGGEKEDAEGGNHGTAASRRPEPQGIHEHESAEEEVETIILISDDDSSDCYPNSSQQIALSMKNVDSEIVIKKEQISSDEDSIDRELRLEEGDRF